MYTKPFSALSKHDAAIAGGKGASLGEMWQAGIPVPEGFVVTAQAFDYFLSNSDVSDSIKKILSTLDVEDTVAIDNASDTITQLILTTPLPDVIADDIHVAHRTLGSQYVAVRSSATAEDGAHHAWAGQLSSYLNVTSDLVVDRVRECWASLYTARAIMYRLEKGLRHDPISVAVVIQAMVNAEKSGVAFSVHPVSEDPNHVIIEAGLGLGEAIVSGEITPDSYVIHKYDKRILEVKVGNQSKGLFRSETRDEDGYNTWRIFDAAEAARQVLAEVEIMKLSSLVQAIEVHYGFPCDIEWAYENGSFFITQSRPITTLGSTDQSPAITYEKVWEAGKAPIFEMTHGTSLAYQVQQQIGLVDEQMVIVGTKKKISAYHATSSLQQAAISGRNYFSNYADSFLEAAHQMCSTGLAYVHQGEDKPVTLETFTETSNVLRQLFAYFNATNPQFTSAIEADTLGEITTFVGESAESIFRDLCVSEKVSLMQTEQVAWMELVIDASKSLQGIDERIERHYNSFKYLVGDEGNVAMSPYSLREQLEKELRDVTDYTATLHSMKVYTEESIEQKKRLIEQYNLPEHLVKQTVLLADIGHIRLELRSAWTAVMHLLRKQLAILAVDQAVEVTVLEKYTADEIVSIIKSGRAFADRPDNFSVSINAGNCTILFGNLAKTKADFNVPAEASNDGNTLIGSTAFPGVVEGPVVVLDWGAPDFNEKIQSFPKGAILVAGQTRPMLVPAIKKAAAIVTDEGGITSHAAIVAREFKKPCVIGTKSATELLHDGEIVIVDATKGTVIRVGETIKGG